MLALNSKRRKPQPMSAPVFQNLEQRSEAARWAIQRYYLLQRLAAQRLKNCLEDAGFTVVEFNCDFDREEEKVWFKLASEKEVEACTNVFVPLLVNEKEGRHDDCVILFPPRLVPVVIDYLLLLTRGTCLET